MGRSETPLRIVIPAYREAPNLPSLCERITAAVRPTGLGYRLFIVDDGSPDDTVRVLAELRGAHPISELRHPVNRGIAAAFLTGMRAAVAGAAEDDAVVVLEGDGTSDPALIPTLAAALSGPCDAAIASRYAPGGAYLRFPCKRLFLSHAANALLRWVCRMPGVRDYTIFFRAYRAGPLSRALAAYGDRFTSVGGFACNAEMLLRLAPFIRAVREIPLVYDYGLRKGQSSMRIATNILSYGALFRVFFFERRAAP
jgi:dolichol-phosphate mannosyltransferase